VFSYQLNPQQLSLLNCSNQPICYDCLYNLKITINSDCNTTQGFPYTLVDSNFTIGQSLANPTCNSNGNTTGFFNDNFTINFPEGSYTITKVLSLSSSAQQAYRNVYIKNDTCKTFQDFYNTELQLLNSQSNCNMTCASCDSAIGANVTSFINKFITQSGTALPADSNWTMPLSQLQQSELFSADSIAQLTASYNQARSNCADICNGNNSDGMDEIRSLEQIMLQDVTPPNGQYAKTDATSTQQLFNIFNGSNYFPNYFLYGARLLGNAPYLVPKEYTPGQSLLNDNNYYNSLGLVDNPVSPPGTNAPIIGNQYDLPPSQFSDQFQSSWAMELLAYHPEFLKLKASLELLPSSYQYEATLNSINTFTGAAQYLSGFSILTSDPFFNGVGSNYKSIMLGKMVNYPGVSIASMWQLAQGAAVDPTASSVTDIPIVPPANPTNGCSADWNNAWVAYRTMYLTLRQKFISEYLNNYQASYAPLNDQLFTNPAYTGLNYQQRFIDASNINYGNLGVNSQNSTFFNNMANGDSIGEAALQHAQFDSTCVGYADTWIAQLEQCTAIGTISSADSLWLINHLVNICVGGSDTSHIAGSSSLPSGFNPPLADSTGSYYKSFSDVIDTFLNRKGIAISDLCYPQLITVPSAYGNAAPLTNQMIITKPNTCECTRLSSLENEYQSAGYGGTFTDYLFYKYGAQITEGAVDTLMSLCNGTYTCNFLPNPISLPVALQCPSPQTCIFCSDLQNIRNSFYTEFGQQGPVVNPQTASDTVLNIAFQNFANNKTGFTETWQDYVTFEDSCTLVSSALKGTYSSDSLANLLSYYKHNILTTYIPHLDAGGCDTTNIKINTGVNGGGWNDDSRFPLGQWMNNGIFQMPETDTSYFPYITSANLNYVDTLCLNNAFDFETSIQFPVNAANKAQYVSYGNPPFYYGTEIHQFIFDNMNVGVWLTPWNDFGATNSIYAYVIYEDGNGNVVSQHRNISTGLKDLSSWTDLRVTFKDGVISTNVNGRQIDTMQYSYHFTRFYELASLPSGYDLQTDWWKMYDTTGALRYFEDFLGCNQLGKQTLLQAVDGNCVPDCQQAFANYFNSVKGTSYNFNTIDSIYYINAGFHPDPCDTASQVPPTNPSPCGLGTIAKLNSPASITIDGNIDNTWNITSANYIQNTTVTTPAKPANLSANWKAMWDSSYLYLLVHVQDSVIRPYPGSGFDYNYDAVEVFLSGNNNKGPSYGANDFQYIFDYGSGANHTTAVFTGPNNGGTGSTNTSGISYAIGEVPDSSGYNMEIKIPWSNIGITPGLYSNIGLDVAVDDDDNNTGTRNAQIEWNTTSSQAFNNPGLFGTTQLVNCSAQSLSPDGPSLCGLNQPVAEPVNAVEAGPCDNIPAQAFSAAMDKWRLYNDSISNVFDTAYYNKCMSAKNLESFTVNYTNSEYHYTLYYYDQAGNLVRTVPPAGVDISKFGWAVAYTDSVNKAQQNNTVLVPAHTMTTDYRYNTLNQVVAQKTPDAGVSNFWYDLLGRLAVSQNAKQADPTQSGGARYSYTSYDILGRITQVGQLAQSTAMTETISRDQDYSGHLSSWINSGAKEQVTTTIYDVPYSVLNGLELNQQNLRNRVSYTYVQNGPVGTVVPWDAATFYSYDIEGNVDTLLQDYNNPGMEQNGNRYKKIVYNYDLISGKVNEVSYDPGMADQFYHVYSYDAENRVINVYTSHDSLIWEQDARYAYYKHGPLARTIIGQQQVQGIDYAYTLQGWLKNVNGLTTLSTVPCTGSEGPVDLDVSNRNQYGRPSDYKAPHSITFEQGYETSTTNNDSIVTDLDPSITPCNNSASPAGPAYGDIGGDGIIGSANANVARDAYSFNLNYFSGDYQPVSVNNVNAYTQLPALPYSNTGEGLFNGNISSMAVNIPTLGNAQLYGYRYDQLNRIKCMDVFTGLNTTVNIWSPILTEDYNEHVSYDPNGNILTYNRNGAQAVNGISMDKLTYHYNTGNNQLNHVNDAVPANNYTEDIDDQNINNYTYDAIGNLISDAQGGISNLTWTVYGKIQTITKTNGTTISYTYDASGNRITKVVIPSSGSAVSTLYVRDATGNIMSIYTIDPSINSGHITQNEVDLYGSSRLGTFNVNRDVNNLAPVDDTNLVNTFTRGNKFFELS
jgi:YD repeat-containing protein